MILTDRDKRVISDKYSGLKIESRENECIIKGSFSFSAAFDSTKKAYVLNPDSTHKDLPIIKDTYQIEIIIPRDDQSIPTVKETEGRIPANPDYHKYPSGSLCYIGPLDDVSSFSVLDFIDGPVLQYFYDQSYHKLYGSWPRKEYSHYSLGIIENYYTNIGQDQIEEKCLRLLRADPKWQEYKAILLGGTIKGHHPCICGSGKNYRKCHSEVFGGLWNLQKYVKQHKVAI